MEMKQRSAAASALLPAAAVAVTLVCLAAAFSSAAGESETRRRAVAAVYVFGDSLVDVGNNDFLPPPAPRAVFPCGVDLPGGSAGGRTGRFTNGYNLADIIAQHVGFNMSPPAYLSLTPETSLDLLTGRVGANYASGGSGIFDTTGNGTITLREQVQLFAATKEIMLTAGELGRRRLNRLLSESLFLFSAGGNDFSAFADGMATMSDAPAFIASMVSTYIKNIKALYRLGVRRVALLDVLPIGCLPSTRGGDDGACDAAANSLARRFNALLRREMAGAAVVAGSMPGLRYSVASIYDVFSDMIADPRLAGLEEVASACCGGGGRFNAEASCSASSSLCADRGKYVFWDKVHGTQTAYQHAVLAFFLAPAAAAAERYTEPVDFTELIRKQRAPPGAAVDLGRPFADRAADI